MIDEFHRRIDIDLEMVIMERAHSIRTKTIIKKLLLFKIHLQHAIHRITTMKNGNVGKEQMIEKLERKKQLNDDVLYLSRCSRTCVMYVVCVCVFVVYIV